MTSVENKKAHCSLHMRIQRGETYHSRCICVNRAVISAGRKEPSRTHKPATLCGLQTATCFILHFGKIGFFFLASLEKQRAGVERQGGREGGLLAAGGAGGGGATLPAARPAAFPAPGASGSGGSPGSQAFTPPTQSLLVLRQPGALAGKAAGPPLEPGPHSPGALWPC